MLADASRTLARTVADPGIEGMFNLGDLDPRAAYPETGADSLLVVNTLPWPRKVIVVEPEQRGWAAPAGVPEWIFPRDVPWGGFRPETPYRRVAGEVPALGYAFLPLTSAPAEDDLKTGANTIENAHYRVRIDPATGAVAEWFDKELGHDFAGKYQGWGVGQYVYERVESDEDRQALFWGDFSAPDFGYGRTDTPWQRWTVESADGQRTGHRSRQSVDRRRGQRTWSQLWPLRLRAGERSEIARSQLGARQASTRPGSRQSSSPSRSIWARHHSGPISTVSRSRQMRINSTAPYATGIRSGAGSTSAMVSAA